MKWLKKKKKERKKRLKNICEPASWNGPNILARNFVGGKMTYLIIHKVLQKSMKAMKLLKFFGHFYSGNGGFDHLKFRE